MPCGPGSPGRPGALTAALFPTSGTRSVPSQPGPGTRRRPRSPSAPAAPYGPSAWSCRCGTGEEMDLGAVLARGPGVALVDDFAHRNAPGSRHRARWQDVEDLLAAGIDVILTRRGGSPGFLVRRGG